MISATTDTSRDRRWNKRRSIDLGRTRYGQLRHIENWNDHLMWINRTCLTIFAFCRN